MIRHPITGPFERVQLGGFEAPRTKQSFKKECDINFIMQKYQRSGAITHFATHAPQYGFADSHDLKAAMDIIATANTMYEELPSSIRKRFTTPADFLDFVQDEKNLDEMRELGLANPLPDPQPSPDPDPPAPDPNPGPDPTPDPA